MGGFANRLTMDLVSLVLLLRGFTHQKFAASSLLLVTKTLNF